MNKNRLLWDFKYYEPYSIHSKSYWDKCHNLQQKGEKNNEIY